MGRTYAQGGFISWIILIVVALLIASFFGINIQSLVENETTQENFAFAWGWAQTIWVNYLEPPATWLWENIVLFIWNQLFIPNLESLQSGDSFNDLRPTTPGTN